MSDREIKMGKLGKHFKDGKAKSITLCVTEECNLRCKYCYMTSKNSFHRMSFDVAKQTVDFFLSQEVTDDAVIWDFIGGEPLLEIDLIDQISDYIKQQMYLRNHPWFHNYAFNLGTNGLLYNHPKVQAYLKKNATHISVTVTIDGTRKKHDLNRVFPDGSGSYDAIIENVILWKKQFPNAQTKVTFSSADLKYLSESIIHLWNLGLNIIPANVVFEDVWKDGDADIYYEQLMALADYILDNELWYDYSVRFFDPSVGHPVGESEKMQHFCGTGKMAAVDCFGNIYPCIRFLDFCVSGKPAVVIGNIHDGIDENKLKPFKMLNIGLVNDDECNQCQIASGCFSCSGCNYEYSITNSIFNRTKFHCELQKIQAKCNEYFWTEVSKRIHAVTPFEKRRAEAFRLANWQVTGAKYLYFLLSDDSPSHCIYTPHHTNVSMNKHILDEGLSFAHDNHMIPVFLGNPYVLLDEVERYRTHIIIDYASHLGEPVSEVAMQIPIVETANDIEALDDRRYSSIILPIAHESIDGLADKLIYLSKKVPRINIIKRSVTSWDSEDLNLYCNEIAIYTSYSGNGVQVSVNIFDHKENATSQQCQAGRSDFSLAPNGSFYACPAFYYQDPTNTLGNLANGLLVQDADLYGIQKATPCKHCANTNCVRCIFMNRAENGTINVASSTQCKIAELEQHLGEKCATWRG